MSSQNFRTFIQVQNKCKTVSEPFLQNVHRSFLIKPNPNYYELHTMALLPGFFMEIHDRKIQASYF